MRGRRYSRVTSITSRGHRGVRERQKVSCRRRRRKRGGRRIDILLPSYQPESERCARDREIPQFWRGGGGLTSYYPPTNPRARDAQGIEKSQNFFPFVSLSFHSYFVMYEGARAYGTCWRSVGVKPKRGGQRAVGY